ncbi:MAG TPA: N-acetylmuramoyl-L-alanine amidase [Actinomycetota bacterium]|nr:N-acetylmuramoyl-L-alanine amidase [Actinomycetota bacterium]
MPLLRRGDRGEAVRDLQARLTALGYAIDPAELGQFGPSTERAVREFQQRRQLLVDGVVGHDTWQDLVEAGYTLGDRTLYLRSPYQRGDDVRELQRALNVLGFDAGREDGIFGERTDRAVREFQRNVGLAPDGIVGATTIQALRRLRPVAPGPGRATVREMEALRRLSASLQGARIAIDPGHGPGDPGGVGPGGLTEAEATLLLAHELALELSRRGAAPFLLRDAHANPSVHDRARRANELGPEVLVAIHLNSHEDPPTEGAATYYFGTERWHSVAGQRLAGAIQTELCARLGLRDCGVHPKSIPILRETRMPAVQVEPCFVTNPREEALLRHPRFRRALAEAMAHGVERFFRGAAAQPGTSASGRG